MQSELPPQQIDLAAQSRDALLLGAVVAIVSRAAAPPAFHRSNAVANYIA
jgi:hypothetical protein